MSRRSALIVLLAALALGLVGYLAGCKVWFSASAGGGEVARALKEGFEQANPQRTLRDVRCADVKWGGDGDGRLDCTATDDRGLELVIGGEVTGIDGLELEGDFRVERVNAPGERFAGVLERALAGEDIAVEAITCPRRVEVADGSEFDCAVRLPGGGDAEIRARYTQADDRVTIIRSTIPQPRGKRS